MQATTTLPTNYRRQATLDVSQETLAILGAIVSGIVLLLAVGCLLVQYTNLFRPEALDGLRARDILTTTPNGDTSITIPFELTVDVVIASALVMLIHELVHGVFFWRFSGKRPTVGLKGIFVYVAAPSEVYFPRDAYLIVGMAPLVLLTLVGLLLALVVPAVIVRILMLFVALNAAGAAGDLQMVVRLLSYSPDTLMQDIGTSVAVYGPQQSGSVA